MSYRVRTQQAKELFQQFGTTPTGLSDLYSKLQSYFTFVPYGVNVNKLDYWYNNQKTLDDFIILHRFVDDFKQKKEAYIRASEHFKKQSFIISSICDRFDFQYFLCFLNQLIKEEKITLNVVKMFCYVVDWENVCVRFYSY